MSQTSLTPVPGEPAPSADSRDDIPCGNEMAVLRALSCNLKQTHLHFGADKVLVCVCQQKHRVKPAQESRCALLPLAHALWASSA